MSELTQDIQDKLPDDFLDNIQDPDYNEETAAKNYGVQVIKRLGLEYADYEQWISSEERPDFIWNDIDGITRIVGEFKAPWNEDHSPSNPEYKLDEGINQSEGYNDTLKLKYILVCDGRWIYLEDTYEDISVKLDLKDVFENPDEDEVEIKAANLEDWLTNIYGGVWNEEPSERDISDEEIFSEFIESSKKALNTDLLPSIEDKFDQYADSYEEYQEKLAELEEEREQAFNKALKSLQGDLYRNAVREVNEDISYDYQEDFRDPPPDVDADRSIARIDTFVDEIRGIRTEKRQLKHDYRLARNWHDKWTYWLYLMGVNYEDSSQADKAEIRETFHLQTLNVLYNRLLLIRVFEDLGIIGQIVSDGFIKTFDEKVKLRWGNKYEEPLETASRQAREVYNPLFERDTPHDWYHYDENVLKTVLRRFDNFNFRNINRDIFGEMYQRCLDSEKRERLGSYYTPPEAIDFLLDYAGFTKDDRVVRQAADQVIDPACGSGTFLLKFIERLIDAEEQVGRDLSNESDLTQIIELVDDKLTGFDVDPFAVQLAQSNLLIRIIRRHRDSISSHSGSAVTLEAEEHLNLPEFPVYETDSLLTQKSSGAFNKDRFYRAQEKDPAHRDEIIESKEQDYQLVMGNPPYVRLHNQDPEYSELYRRLHETFTGQQPDLFIPFVEQAIEWLDEGGKLTFVISDRFFVNREAQEAMENILEKTTIDLVVDMTRTKMFGDEVDIFPMLMVLTKRSGEDNAEVRKNNEITAVKVFTKGSVLNKTWARSLEHAASEVIEDREEPDYDFETDFEARKPEYEDITTDDTYSVYNLSQSRFTENTSSWIDQRVLNFQIQDDLWEVILNMEDFDDCVPLNRVTQLGGDSNKPVRGEEKPPIDAFEVEDKDDGVPVYTGGNLRQFYIKNSTKDIDTYVDLEEMKSAVYSDGDDDRELPSENKLDVMLEEDIIAWRYNASGLSFVVDSPDGQERFLNKRVYHLILQEPNGFQFYDRNTNLDPHYLCGVLNSSLLDFYYKGYYEHKAFRHAPSVDIPADYLEDLPIQIPTEDEEQSIAEISKSLHQKCQERYQKEDELDSLFMSFEKDGSTQGYRDYVQRVTKEQDYSINSLDMERDGEELDLNRFFGFELYSQQDADELENFLDEFAEEYDDEEIIGGKLDDIGIPEDFDEFRRRYDELSDQISALNNEIEEQRAALDEKVYQMYDVEEENQDKIEEYLDEFLTVIE